jgi:DNA gyrase subunit B
LDTSKLEHLTASEAVRRRPGMYLGGTDLKALHHMVDEVLNVGVDFALAEKCSLIDITLRQGNEVCIRDNGPGLPVARTGPDGKTVIEAIFAYPSTGRLNVSMGPHCVQGGLHGIGMLAINALSEWMAVENHHEGYLWKLSFNAGVQSKPIEQIRNLRADEPTGLSITFRPDFTILERNDLAFDTIANRANELSYLIPGLMILLRDERVQPIQETRFLTTDGIVSFAHSLVEPGTFPQPIVHGEIDLGVLGYRDSQSSQKPDFLRFAVAFTAQESRGVHCFVNTIRTLNVGTQMDGFRDGIQRSLNQSGNSSQNPILWSDIEKHLTAVISVLYGHPQYASLSRIELLNPEIVEPVATAVYGAFAEFAEAQPDQMQKILEICRD